MQREFDRPMKSNAIFHGMWEEGICSIRDSHKWMDKSIPTRVFLIKTKFRKTDESATLYVGKCTKAKRFTDADGTGKF
jgi:hypothetical protein